MNKSNLDVTPPVGRRAAATAGACSVAPALFAMHKHLEHGSKRYFRQAGAIFFPFLLFTGLWPPPLSPSSPPSVFPLFFGRVFFSRRHLLQIVLSLSWLAGTPLGGGQSPPEWEENTRMHAHLRRWTHVIKRKHGHAQRHITHTHTRYTRRRRRRHSLPKSSSVRPSHPTLDKPLVRAWQSRRGHSAAFEHLSRLHKTAPLDPIPTAEKKTKKKNLHGAVPHSVTQAKQFMELFTMVTFCAKASLLRSRSNIVFAQCDASISLNREEPAACQLTMLRWQFERHQGEGLEGERLRWWCQLVSVYLTATAQVHRWNIFSG